MKQSRRFFQRLPICLEAKFVYNSATCFAYIENISECGIYVRITCIERIEDLKSDTNVNVRFRLPSGRFINLLCKEAWSKIKISNSLIEHIGMEIIDAPEEYKYLYQAVKFGVV